MISRSITGLALAALLVAPAAAHGATKGTDTSSGVWLGGLFGAELGDFDGWQFRFDAEVPITRPSPQLQVEGVLSASYAGLAHDIDVFELVPAARLTWFGTPKFGAYGDLGLGYSHASQNGNGMSGATMRIGAGAFYSLAATARIVAEFAIHPHFGDYDQTTTTVMIGLKFGI